MLPDGVYPAAVTPMFEDGSVDSTSLPNLLAHFRTAGCKGMVIAGTNGEGPSLAAVEKRDLVRLAVPLFPDFKIILGVATPSLEEAIWSCNQAHKAGAAAGLVMAPAYFREATEEGVARWFERLFEASELPILVYNFPQRTGFTFSADLLRRLAEHPRMVGAKDSSGERSNLRTYASAMSGKRLFVGNETLLWEALEEGWNGTISGAANVIPDWLVQVIGEREADPESAEAKFQLALRGIEALRAGSQPALNKALLHRLGVLATPGIRLPLQGVSQTTLEEVQQALHGLVKFPRSA